MRQEIRELVYNKCNGRCAYCGGELDFGNMHIDHIIPQKNFIRDILEDLTPDFLLHLTIEDLNSIDNLLPSCRSCNIFKSSFTLEQFRYELSQQIFRLKKNPQFMRVLKFGQVSENIKPIVFYFETLGIY